MSMRTADVRIWQSVLSRRLWATFKRKTDRIQATAMPIIKQVYENQGAMYERIMVPITDGKRMYNIPCNLKEAYESEAKNVVKEFEKSVVLQIIDDHPKENLRKLDERSTLYRMQATTEGSSPHL